jgi:hypothetical protein
MLIRLVMVAKKIEHKVVSFVDVNDILKFTKKECRDLDSQIKEEKRVEDELKKFIGDVQKHSGHMIHHIGNDKKSELFLVRFLFKDGGFLEVVGEKPLSLNAHFISKKEAEKFAEGLKKTLNQYMPDTTIKSMVVDSVQVTDGKQEDMITLEKWSKMHKIAVNKTVVVTIVALIIYVTIEITKALLQETTAEFFPIHSIILSLITAVILAFSFDPIKNKLDEIIEKIYSD